MRRKKLIIRIAIFSMIVSMCGGSDDATPTIVEETTTTSTTTTFAPSKVEVFNEADLVVPPILLKPLIGATGILTSTSADWEVLTEIVSLDMGVKVRTADNGTAQMTFEDGSSLLICLLYTSPSPRDRQKSRMPSSA